MSSDGTCAIDIAIGSLGRADADIVSWGEIRVSAQRIVDDCVEGTERRNPGLGGVIRYLGQQKRLFVVVRSYEPTVQCHDREFNGQHCLVTLSQMHVSGNPMNWRREGTTPVGRINIFVPKAYSDPTNSCFATIKLSSGDVEQGSYTEMWEGANAVYWMCIRYQHDGVSFGHGRNGRLQVHLGRQEWIPSISGVDIQR
ncbi:MAG: hypothetical protein HETSPECPRED_006288 [Heterodermia speciosa]|uniref:Uncharacterized protein n=1 Tax=Heterodermia speciosa TaxID=116794 RepID=A0A8H3IFM5_9LECA|nr:MAG: hypothetical protein HETSPECPRED_006288 [Heterodermia speciosa]